MRTAADAGPGHNLAGRVGGATGNHGNKNTARESSAVPKELARHRCRRQCRTVENSNMRTTAVSCPCYDVGNTVTRDFTHRHIDAAAERWIIGIELGDQSAGRAVEYAHDRPTPVIGRDDDVGLAVAGE